MHSSPTESAPRVNEELVLAYKTYPVPAVVTLEMLPALRTAQAALYNAGTMTLNQPLVHKEYKVASYDSHEVVLSVFTPSDDTKHSLKKNRPWIYYIHGGGFVMGSRFLGIDFIYPLPKELGAVLISVEHRLAPEYKAPAAMEDCYAGLVWAANNAGLLGIDRTNCLVWGSSSGGGLAASIGMMVRDHKPAGGLQIKGLLMHYPMLENNIDADDNVKFSGSAAPSWSSESNEMGWKAYLADSSADQNPYAVPARATDLANLPPVFIDVGGAELFCRPAIKFAQAVWEAGGLVEVHVSAGAFHASDIAVPDAAVSRRAVLARTSWARDMFTSRDGDIEGNTTCR